MKVWSASGSPYNDTDHGELFFITKFDALASARENTKGTTYEATIIEHHINGPFTPARVVALLNGEGWCDHQEVVAKVVNGRIPRGTAR